MINKMHRKVWRCSIHSVTVKRWQKATSSYRCTEGRCMCNRLQIHWLRCCVLTRLCWEFNLQWGRIALGPLWPINFASVKTSSSPSAAHWNAKRPLSESTADFTNVTFSGCRKGRVFLLSPLDRRWCGVGGSLQLQPQGEFRRFQVRLLLNLFTKPLVWDEPVREQ